MGIQAKDVSHVSDRVLSGFDQGRIGQMRLVCSADKRAHQAVPDGVRRKIAAQDAGYSVREQVSLQKSLPRRHSGVTIAPFPG